MMTSSLHRRNAGFSMVEMMVVLLVLGITLAATVPNITRYRRHDQVRMTAEKFRAICSLAQRRAMATRTEHRVVYATGEDAAFYLQRWDGGDWEMVSQDTIWADPGIGMVGSTDGSPGHTRLTFEPLGTVDMADVPATVQFYNSHRDTSTVRVVRTGRMSLRHN
jgi:prepilin-type N-terminal cleavage/methylation domain-containing protein